MLETEIAKLTDALVANTAALNAVLAAAAAVAPQATAPQETAKATKKKAAPAPAPAPAPSPAPAEAEAEAEAEAKAEAKAEAESVTTGPVPHDNEHPEVPEFVDVEAVVAQITELVKNRILAASPADAADVKARWTAVRQYFKVDRISDLKNNPTALLEALAEAKKL